MLKGCSGVKKAEWFWEEYCSVYKRIMFRNMGWKMQQDPFCL